MLGRRRAVLHLAAAGMDDPLEAVRSARWAESRGGTGSARAKIGYEGSFESVAPPHNAGEPWCPANLHRLSRSRRPLGRLADATDLLHEQRATKRPVKSPSSGWPIGWPGFGLEKFHASRSARQVRGGTGRRGLCRVPRPRRSAAAVRHVNVFPQVSSGPNAHRAWRPVVTTGGAAFERRDRRAGAGCVRRRVLGRRNAGKGGRPSPRPSARGVCRGPFRPETIPRRYPALMYMITGAPPELVSAWIIGAESIS